NSLSQGTYLVTVTDFNGCMDTTIATISDVNGPDLSAITTPINCFGDLNGSIDLTIVGINPFTIDWSGPSSFASNLEDINGLAAGIYIIAVTDNNGCTSNDFYTVGGPTNPISVTAVITDPLCNG